MAPKRSTRLSIKAANKAEAAEEPTRKRRRPMEKLQKPPQTKESEKPQTRKEARRSKLVKEPEKPQPTKKSRNSRQTEEPQNLQQADKPEDSQTIEEPQNLPPKEEFQNSQPTEEPENSQPTEELPNSQPMEELPNAQPMEELPNAKPMEELPNSQPTDELPNSKPTEEHPNSQPTEELLNPQPSEEPPNSQPTGESQNSQPTKEPPSSEPMEEPTDSQPTQEPQNSQPTEEPSNSPSTEEPLNSQPTGEPLNSQPPEERQNAQEEPQNAQPTEEPRNLQSLGESSEQSTSTELLKVPEQELPNDTVDIPINVQQETQNVQEVTTEEATEQIIVLSMQVEAPANVAAASLEDQQAAAILLETAQKETSALEIVENNATSSEQRMEVDQSHAAQSVSVVVSEEAPCTSVAESPIRSQGPPMASSTPVCLPGSTPGTPSTSILIQAFDSEVTPVSLMNQQQGGSQIQYVSFDQESLMSSTLGTPGVRKCGICGKVYRNRNGLYKHRLAKHPQLVNANKPIHCQTPGCDFDCHRLEVLREHIVEVHKIPMTIKTGTFANMAEYILWKEALEKDNCANFVKTRGASGNTQGVYTKHRYYCSRSGFHNSKSTGKRRKVTTKMGAYCTAGINVLEHKSTGEIKAEACITHHGHPIQLEYLKIPAKDKREIANKIVKGKKWEHILAEYHESGLKQGTRSSILTKKDLMNIQRIVKKHLPGEQADGINIDDQQVEIDSSSFDWVPPPSATESETEIAIESLQRLGEVVTTNIATLRDNLLGDLDQIASSCKDCQDRDSLLMAGGHVKNALNVFKEKASAAGDVNGDGLSNTHLVVEHVPPKTDGSGDGNVVTTQVAGVAGTTGAQSGEQVQTVEIAESAMNLLESMEKDNNTGVRVPAADVTEGEDDMPVITYRLVPASAENATCPLDSLATTSQYRTLGIRLTKEMLYTLSLICEKHQMDRLLSGGNLINREEVEIICSKLPDEVIDADMTSIRVLLERDAWYLLESAVDLKRNDWKCGLCDKVTGKLHMIRCCSCNCWFHWVCVEIEEQPTEEWFCPGCILRKRMQAIQTRQSTKKIAASQE